MRLVCFVCSFLVALGATTFTFAQSSSRYAFLTLPPLGGEDSYGWGINELGAVVGSAFLPGNSEFHASLWIDGVPVDLGTLGGRYSCAEGANSSGWIVGWAVQTGGGLFDERAVLWRDGQILDLGTLGGDVARAHAVNERGDIVGQSYIVGGNGRIRAFVWRDGVMENLEWFDEDGSTFAYAINDAGQIAGRGWRPEMFCHRAALWDNGEIIDLGTLRPDNTGTSEAYSINDLGQIVGFAQGWAYRYYATLWYDGQAYELGTPRGTSESYAESINNRGQIVGEGYINHRSVGFLWESNAGMQRLDDLLPARTVFYPRLALAINEAGQITGIASPKSAPESQDLAYIMSPVNPTLDLAAPAPGSAGIANTINVTNVTPGARVVFLYSKNGGGTRIPGCDLQQNALQLDNPTVIGSAIADSNGVASITRNVPLIARGQTILFQAVVQNECAISQLVVHEFQ